MKGNLFGAARAASVWLSVACQWALKENWFEPLLLGRPGRQAGGGVADPMIFTKCKKFYEILKKKKKFLGKSRKFY